MPPRAKSLAFGILSGTLFVTACWTANLTAFHYFAADFPNDPTREWHEMWGTRFLVTTVLLLLGCALGLWRFLKTKRGVTH